MKMTPGTAPISNYGSYTNNCTKKQRSYRVPIDSLADVQLYIAIGAVRPTTVLIELLHTCGALAGTVETLAASSYVVGQDANNNWYGVFKGLTGGTDLSCFVIAITLDDAIYFSEEYCIDPCETLVELKGCKGHLAPALSVDCQGIYFGVHAGPETPLGNVTTVYEHKLKMRSVEVTISAIKNSFKQGRTRTFRTEKEKIYQFYSELVPEWYLPYVDAVFERGEVYIDEIKYLLNETQYEKVEECFKSWKPWATLKESCYQSFSCETEPCAPINEGECCDPIILNATVANVAEESEGSEPPIAEETPETIVIEGLVDGDLLVSGTEEAVTGIADGSSVITCAGFAGVRVIVERGFIPLPGVDPGGGGAYYTKVLEDDFITLSQPLANGEYLYIQTIPE